MTIESEHSDLIYFDVIIQYFYSKENSSQFLIITKERVVMFSLFIHKRD